RWEDTDVAGAVFAGCALDGDAEATLRARGANVLPPIQGIPFDPYRSRLYTTEELMAGYVPGDPASPLDARIGRSCTGPASPLVSLARGIHDACIDAALLR